MKVILQLLLTGLWLFIVPFIIGGLWTKPLKRYHDSIAMTITCGWMTMFATFQLLAVPLILCTSMKLFTFLIIWCSVLLALLIASIVLNWSRAKEFISGHIKQWKEYKNVKGLFSLIAVGAILILFQAAITAYLDYPFIDDIRYVATANDAYATDTMLEIEPVSGEYVGHPVGEMLKDACAPIIICWAAMSKLTMIHPATFEHVMVQFVFVLVAYMIMYLLGSRLFRDERKNISLFMIVLSVVMLFGGYSWKGNFARSIYMNLFYGKNMLTVIIIPFLLFLLWKIKDEEENKVYYPLLFMTMIAASLMSTMAATIPTVFLGTFAVVYAVSNRSFKPLIRILICCVPCLCYGLLYYFMTGGVL